VKAAYLEEYSGVFGVALERRELADLVEPEVRAKD
jgi:hypothetical protein